MTDDMTLRPGPIAAVEEAASPPAVPGSSPPPVQAAASPPPPATVPPLPPLDALQGFDAAKLVALARARGGEDGGDLRKAVARAETDPAALAPRDAIEAKLASLFLLNVEGAAREMACAAGAASPAVKESSARLGDRMARTALALSEALDRRRRLAEQRIVVEKLAVGDGGRVVVGTVAGEGRGGG